jgi:glycosyltransferase involved in cell wall biosynthesis
MEVLVVDGMSEDGTRERLADWCRKHPALRVLDNPQRIVPTAMNIGIRSARGQWIIRLDAHSEYPPNYFTRCLETSRRMGRDNVGGSFVTMANDGTRQARLVQALITHRFGVGNSPFRVGASEGAVDTVPYGCYRLEVFERIGLYDERLERNQDYELNCRLRKSGGSVWYDAAIRIFYYGDRTITALLRKMFVTGQWNPWTWYVAPYSFAWRHAVPASFVAALLGAAALFAIEPFLGQLALASLLVPHLMIGLAAAFQQARRYGLWMFPWLPPLFLGYHVTYGLGTLWGICVLALGRAPVQRVSEPWPGAGAYRAWPLKAAR